MSNVFQLRPERDSSHDGWCPHCPNRDGIANVGRDHWGFCLVHKTKWLIGSNLYSGWRDQTEEEQRKTYDEIGLGYFREVEGVYPTHDPFDRESYYHHSRFAASPLRRIRSRIAGWAYRLAIAIEGVQDDGEIPF